VLGKPPDGIEVTAAAEALENQPILVGGQPCWYVNMTNVFVLKAAKTPRDADAGGIHDSPAIATVRAGQHPVAGGL
jgi:hypothetical protein